MLSLRISKFAAKTYGYGYLGQKETFGRHGEDQKQGHETGTYRPPLLVPPGLPLSQECEEIAGYTRHVSVSAMLVYIHQKKYRSSFYS